MERHNHDVAAYLNLEIRRQGTILDLVHVDLDDITWFVITIREDKHILCILCEDVELKTFGAGDNITFKLADEFSSEKVKAIKPKLVGRSRLFLTRYPPILSFLDWSKSYGHAEWTEEITHVFETITSEGRHLLESVTQEESFVDSFLLCRVIVEIALYDSASDDITHHISLKKESLSELQRLHDLLQSNSSSGAVGVTQECSELLINAFGSLEYDSNGLFRLMDIIEKVEHSHITNSGVEYLCCPNMTEEEAAESVLNACRFMQAAMLYRMAVVLLVKHKPEDFCSRAFTEKQMKKRDKIRRLERLHEQNAELDRELQEWHRRCREILTLCENAAEHFAWALSVIDPVGFRKHSNLLKFAFRHTSPVSGDERYKMSFVLCVSTLHFIHSSKLTRRKSRTFNVFSF
uniref:Uncharacterized protein n=1 Tax=Steinernema glaseri TaxID=37863 RepID=A0A1I7ZXQ0_9BILA